MNRFTDNRNKFGNLVFVSTFSLILAACSGSSYIETRDTEPMYEEMTTQKEFAFALQDAYFDYATRAYDVGDTETADYYALRSIMAAEGKIVKPSEVSKDAMGADYAEAKATRNNLISQLNKGAKTNTPRSAAMAQAALDCWLHEKSKNDMSKASTCKAESMDAVEQVKIANADDLKRVASTRPFVQTRTDVNSGQINTEVKGMIVEEDKSPEIVTAATQTFVEPQGEPVKTASLTQNGGVSFISPLMRASMPRKGDFAIYFGFDSSKVTMEAEDILIDVLQQAQNSELRTIVIMGHTDTIGSSRYNNLLSLRRAQEVRKFLSKKLPKNISYRIAALGEADPIIGVGNRISQAANRRVEIAFE